MAAQPTGSRRQQLATRGRSADPTRPLPPAAPGTILDALARQVEDQAEHPALDDGTRCWSYGEVWARSEVIARTLAARGVTTGTRVAVHGPRHAAWAIAALGVLRAGGVFVPSSTAQPAPRRAAMLEAAGATHVVVVAVAGRDGVAPPAWAGPRDVLALDADASPLAAPTAGRDGPLATPGPDAAVFFTSGTTGTPKAVRVPHLAIVDLAEWYGGAFALSPADRVSMVTNVGFVVTLRNLFAPLAAGATVCIAPDELLPEHGLAWVADAGITVLHTTPTAARQWLRHAPAGHPRPVLRWTLFGGEPLDDTFVADWRDAVRGSRRVANVYGATEVAASRAWFEVPAEPEPGVQPVGRAIPGTQLLVVDEQGARCATGVVGELLVRSRSIPDAYAGQVADAAGPYVANPFRRDPDDRVCRTGDLAMVGTDGELRLVGRADDQVKLGGFRIDLGDVATVLRGHEAVSEAEVLAVPGDDGVPALVAFVLAREPAGHPAALQASLRRHCAAHLPLRALPARVVVLDRMPIGPTGKRDRARLLALLDEPAAGPEDPRPDPTAPLPAPPRATVLDDVVRWVHTAPDRVALDDGTRALTFATTWARAGEIAEHLAASGVRTGSPVLVSGPRGAAFGVAMLGVLRAGAVVVPCASMLPDARCASMADEVAAAHIVSVGVAPGWTAGRTTLVIDDDAQVRDTDLPRATPAAPGDHAYVFFTSGTTGAPKAVLGRHASLAEYLRWWRRAFDVGPVDRVSMATSTAFDVTLRNLFGPLVSGATACIAPDGLLPENGLRWLAEARVSVLHVTPSLAASWLAEAPADVAPRVLRWTLFAGEMLTDVLVRRWRAANPGAIGNMYGPTETTMSRCLAVIGDEPLPGAQPVGFPLPGSQVLVVDEQNRLCDIGEPGEVLVRTRAGTAGYANNPAEHAARFVANPFRDDPGDVVYRTGDRGWYRDDGSLQLAGRVDDQVKIGGVRVEPAEVTSALVAHPDVRAAHVQARTTDAGEPELVAFVVTGAGTGAPAGTTAALRRHLGGLLAPAAIPARFVHVDRLPMTSNGKVDRAALLALVDAPASDAPVHDTSAPDARATDAPGRIGLDAMVALWRAVLRRDDLDADTNFFDAGGSSVTAVRLGHRLREHTGRPVGIHDLLDAQTPRELAALLAPPAPPATASLAVHRTVAAHAVTRPTATAIEADGTPVTYAELERRVRAAAHLLAREGVRPGSLVAIHASRTAALVPLLLAAHRAGAGYVPVDPELPGARVAFVLDDAAPALVVTDRPLPEAASAHRTLALATLVAEMDAAAASDAGPVDLLVDDDPEGVAYVIYTSGSTGHPKGVLVPHRALRSFVDAANDRYGMRADDRLLQYHSLSFDTSVEEVFCTLAAGATLVTTAAPLLGSAGWFLEQVERMRITVLDIPTSFWTGLTEDLDDGDLRLHAGLRAVIVGGSAAGADAVNRFNRRTNGTIALVNAYGPTECTIAATAVDLSTHHYAAGELVTIGPALDGVTTLVLDADGRAVGDDEPGELLLGGAQLALGYLNRPELTAERFVVDPTGATDERYYRTGDRVRRRPDGSFVFEARVDDQVKIRGHRFELGEVEAALASHPGVREAVALLDGADGHDARLVAHVVLRDGANVSTEDLRAHVAGTLPAYAVPTSIQRRAALPRTPGGKPDRRALRAGVHAPLGFAQEQQWFLSKLEPGSTAYNLTCTLRVRGPLDHAVLDRALHALAERHESLRTRFVELDDSPVQVIDEPGPVTIERIEVRARAGETLDDAARRTLRERTSHPFDLELGPLYRPLVVRLADDDHLVALRFHHIVVDGWSTDVLVDELLEHYVAGVEGRMPKLGAEVVQPRTLALAERAADADGSVGRAVERVAARLRPAPAPLPFPFDRPRPAVREDVGHTVRAVASAGAADRMRALARELRTTPYAVGLALWAEYVASWCGTTDVIVATPSVDRDTAGSDRTVGMLVNTIAMRVRPHHAQSVRRAVEEATTVARTAIADKAAPFDRVVRALRPPRVPGVHPLVQTMFQVVAPPPAPREVGALTVEPFLAGRNGAKFDAIADLVLGDELACRLVLAADVFTEETAGRVCEQFVAFVDAALAEPDRTVDDARTAVGLASPPVTPAATEPLRVDEGPARPPDPTAEAAGPCARAVAAIMGELVGREVATDDDFFAVGGHSLLAVKLCSIIERRLGARLGIAAVFGAPTPRGLGELLGDDPAPPAPVLGGANPPTGPAPAEDGSSDLVEVVRAALADVLGRPVGPDDDFFGAGGHSLLAVRACSRLERALGRRVEVATFFAHPTARGIAGALGSDPTAPDPGEHLAPAPPTTTGAQPPHTAQPSPHRTVGYERPVRLHLRRAPLSFAQRRLWALEQLGEAGAAYLLTSTYELHGVLDLDALRAAIAATAERHEVLRTRYVLDEATGEPEQVIDRRSRISPALVDLRGREPAPQPTELDDLVRAEAWRGFDLATEHPWRVTVVRVEDGRHLLALSVHHIATDGESQGTIVRDLVRAYNAAVRGEDPATSAPALQYSDHAVWQHARAASGALEPSLAHWHELLTPLPEPLRLPGARTARTSNSGATQQVRGGAARLERVESFAREHRTTTFTVLLSAYALLLHDLTARTDLVVGVPATERSMDGDEETVGFFVNTLPLRLHIDPAAAVADSVRAVQRSLVDALAHADAPFDLVVERLAIARDATTDPLCQTMFSVQDAPGAPPRLDGLLARRRRLGDTGTAKFDLSLIASIGEELDLWFEHRGDVLDGALVEQWGAQYLRTLDALLEDPGSRVDALPRLSPETEAWLVDGCNRTRTAYPRDRTVHELFDEVAAARPDEVAVVDGVRSRTYAELRDDAEALARELRAAGVHSGDRVAVEMGRSLELIVAMLGVLRVGAAYVPVDPIYPDARRSMMRDLARAAASVVLVDGSLAVVPGPARGGAPAAHAVRADDAAYVMFTSGSTGTPKGVVVPHRAIVRLVRDTDYVAFGPELVLAHLSNTSFDAATFEIWGALLNGARLVVLDTDTVTSPASFAEAIRSHGITTMFVTTALFNVMAREAPGAFATVRDLLFGGEAADPHAVRAVLADRPPSRLLNVYGPTESTTFASWHHVERLAEDATTVPIGRPIASTTLHVVDAHGRPVAPLVEGELVIGGDGLALGYLDDDATTAARFVADRFAADASARLYRTGDIVRRRMDGVIEFVGRRDHQVKIRGFRIELGDVEASLRSLDGVDAAHVLARRDRDGDAVLHAYVVATPGTTLDGDALRDVLRATRPAYLVPSAVTVLDALPINANGKIDRDALPAPALTPRKANESVVPVGPVDALEAAIAGIWTEVLERDDFGVEDGFFELGGNSIRAVRVFAAVERATGVRLGLSALFEAPTVRALATLVRAERPALAPAAPTDAPLRSAGDSLFVTLRAGDPARHVPVYLVHPAGGQVFAYAKLLPALAPDRTVIGIREHAWHDPASRLATVEAYAALYADALDAHRPSGPLALGGYSLGGLLAYEMARLLRARGRDVRQVLLLDATPYGAYATTGTEETRRSKARRRLARDGIRGVVGGLRRVVRRRWARLWTAPAEQRRDRRELRAARRAGGEVDPLLLGRISEHGGHELRRAYRPQGYEGRVVFFNAIGTDPDFPIASGVAGWRGLAEDLVVIDVPGNHADEGSMMTEPYVQQLAQRFAEALATDDGGRR